MSHLCASEIVGQPGHDALPAAHYVRRLLRGEAWWQQQPLAQLALPGQRQRLVHEDKGGALDGKAHAVAPPGQEGRVEVSAEAQGHLQDAFAQLTVMHYCVIDAN